MSQNDTEGDEDSQPLPDEEGVIEERKDDLDELDEDEFLTVEEIKDALNIGTEDDNDE